MTFTSELSIDEVLLVEEVGFEPVELVTGASFFLLTGLGEPQGPSSELETLSEVLARARREAMDRLHQQVVACGADGVVGMRVEITHQRSEASFLAIGTAVRRRDGQGAAWRDAQGMPFTCNLSGQDVWALVRGGFRPLALVHGVCAYHVVRRWLGDDAPSSEDERATRGVYDARELAMSRMQADAIRAGGVGMVGGRIEESHHVWGLSIVELVALGTAIAPLAGGAAEAIAPTPVLSLDE
jgi:uncharacterized protein YbjQ (UPF0145 family)